MRVLAVVPARLASSRFPRKVLADATGTPLVQHVVERARRASVNDVLVAADSAEVADALARFGTRVVLTDPDLPSGTDRVAAATRGTDYDVVVNVQGDEPELDPRVIDAVVAALGDADVSTAAAPLAEADAGDANRVKVVVGLVGRALYFSRSPIPFWRDRDPAARPNYRLHLGLYAYRPAFLQRFAALPPTPLERAEKLEQLRALEHGFSIAVADVPDAGHGGIDTPEQYAAFVRRHRG